MFYKQLSLLTFSNNYVIFWNCGPEIIKVINIFDYFSLNGAN